MPEVARMVGGLNSITVSSAQMADLIDELLELARLQVGQSIELDRRPVDLIALTRRAVHEHDQATPRHRIRFETEQEEIEGQWDAARIDRVLDNLLSNAVKYSPAGGEIVVTVTRDGEAGAMLTVTDRGLGIPAADVPRVFERFHRGANVTERIEGTGLGLAGVRHTIEGHGGTVEVATKEGLGSTFTVRLPLDGERPEDVAGADPATASVAFEAGDAVDDAASAYLPG